MLRPACSDHCHCLYPFFLDPISSIKLHIIISRFRFQILCHFTTTAKHLSSRYIDPAPPSPIPDSQCKHQRPISNVHPPRRPRVPNFPDGVSPIEHMLDKLHPTPHHLLNPNLESHKSQQRQQDPRNKIMTHPIIPLHPRLRNNHSLHLMPIRNPLRRMIRKNTQISVRNILAHILKTNHCRIRSWVTLNRIYLAHQLPHLDFRGPNSRLRVPS